MCWHSLVLRNSQNCESGVCCDFPPVLLFVRSLAEVWHWGIILNLLSQNVFGLVLNSLMSCLVHPVVFVYGCVLEMNTVISSCALGTLACDEQLEAVVREDHLEYCSGRETGKLCWILPIACTSICPFLHRYPPNDTDTSRILNLCFIWLEKFHYCLVVGYFGHTLKVLNIIVLILLFTRDFGVNLSGLCI